MTNERDTMIADRIPARYRAWIYTLLGTLAAIEAVWDVVDGATESRIIATLAALGFVLARANTPSD